jgi:diguanylate cyclase (GGDEF)-like protein
MDFDALRQDQDKEARDGHHETSPLIAELAVLLMLAYALSFWLAVNGSILRAGVVVGALAIAGCSAAFATGRAPGPTQAIWKAVPFFCLLLAIGEGARLLEGHFDASMGSRWLVSGIFVLSAYVLLMIGALRAMAGSSVVAWSLALIDLAMIGLAVSAPWVERVILPHLSDKTSSALLPQLVSPVLAAAALVLIALSSRTAPETEVSSFILIAAIGAGLAGALLVCRHLLANGGMTAVHGAMLGAGLLIVIAAESTGRSGKVRVRNRFGIGAARLAVVFGAFAVSLAYASLAFGRGEQLAGFIVASAVSVLLVLRLIVHSLERHRHSARLEEALREQEQLAVMDSLTGLYNRRFLDAELKLELDRSARSKVPVGVLLCDIDHFKQINDEHGHLAGDIALREVARRLLNAVRNGDLVARYGGEEFVVLLPDSGREKLKEIGERCRRAFEEAPFQLPHDHETLVTISIGGACWPEDANTPRGLIEAADAALYQAKAEGRNRIRLSDHAAGVVTSLVMPWPVSSEEPEHTSQAVSTSEPDSLSSETPALEPVRVSAEEVLDGVGTMERWATLVARALGLDENAQRRCALAARYHDIGKSSLPESILGKRGPLSTVEWELVQEHPERGAALVELAPELVSIGDIIRDHHERFDGRGYPVGKMREEISTEARIIACCDAWAAMRTDRPYAGAKSASEARAELLAGRGKQFDPEVVMAFLMFDEGDFEGAERVLGGRSTTV